MTDAIGFKSRHWPHELTISIFKYIEFNALKNCSRVCKHWNQLSILTLTERIQSSISTLLGDKSTPDILPFLSNHIFSLVMPKLLKNDALVSYTTRNTITIDGIELSSALKHLVITCEIGKPCLRIYRSLTDSFTIALAVLMNKPVVPKDAMIASEISFISSSKSSLLSTDSVDWDKVKTHGRTLAIDGLVFYCKLFSWHAPEDFYSTEFVQTFKLQARELLNHKLACVPSRISLE